jgi:hypothetical protein
MFLHVAPETTSHSETLSTLKFGSRVSEITLGQAAKNVERGSPLEIREAQVDTLPLHVTPPQDAIRKIS